MRKQLVFVRNTLPDSNPEGYGDLGNLYIPDDLAGGLPRDPSYSFACSTLPNPTRSNPENPKLPRLPWRAMVSQTNWTALCMMHPRFDKCLLFQNGEVMAAVSRGGTSCMTSEIFFHSGGMSAPHVRSSNPFWRGSLGCFTCHPDNFEKIMSRFVVGETIDCVLIDNTSFTGVPA